MAVELCYTAGPGVCCTACEPCKWSTFLHLSAASKERLAGLMQRRWLQRLMGTAVRLIVPRQRIGVALATVDDRQRILMLRHVFHPTSPWGLPGGWLRRDERPSVGALRELREETGLVARLEQIIYVEHEPLPPHLEVAYLARVTPGPLQLSDEILEAAWFEPQDVPQLIRGSTRRILRAAWLALDGAAVPPAAEQLS